MEDENGFIQFTGNRAPRRDGAEKRAALLEAAGQIFAERGYAATTSKEICHRAGTNSAAVNYYFGGKDGLYQEVLKEAHRQLVSVEQLDNIACTQDAPEVKLRAFLGMMLSAASPATKFWGIRLFLRELVSPSALGTKTIVGSSLPKAARLRQIVHELTGLPLDSEVLNRAVGLVAAPCIGLILFSGTPFVQVYPEMYPNNQESLLDDVVKYVIAGLSSFVA